MKNTIVILACLGTIGCVENGAASTSNTIISTKQETTMGSVMRLEGKLAMKGGSRMSHLAISDISSGITYKIANPNNFNLTNRQNHTVSITAKLIKASVGPGFPAVIEVVTINK